MSVNLDELRKHFECAEEAACSEIDDLYEAVLDAPRRVWWCEVWCEVIHDTETDPPECDSCDPALGCGWVVLVPVEGGET
jgi:hypothetical protein